MSNKAHAPFVDDELTEFLLDYADAEENDELSMESMSQQTRGRQRIQERWTRVIKIEELEECSSKTFIVANDLMVA